MKSITGGSEDEEEEEEGKEEDMQYMLKVIDGKKATRCLYYIWMGNFAFSSMLQFNFYSSWLIKVLSFICYLFIKHVQVGAYIEEPNGE